MRSAAERCVSPAFERASRSALLRATTGTGMSGPALRALPGGRPLRRRFWGLALAPAAPPSAARATVLRERRPVRAPGTALSKVAEIDRRLGIVQPVLRSLERE